MYIFYGILNNHFCSTDFPKPSYFCCLFALETINSMPVDIAQFLNSLNSLKLRWNRQKPAHSTISVSVFAFFKIIILI